MLTNYEIDKSNIIDVDVVVKANGRAVIFVPFWAPDWWIRSYINKYSKRLEKIIDEKRRMMEDLKNHSRNNYDQITSPDVKSPDARLTQEEIKELYKKAKEYIPQRVAYYEPLVGVDHNRICIKMQKTRWGSCSSKGNLNFNCLLMLMPPEVIDSIVVHELCHRIHLNHSKAFYAEVLRVYPDYYKWNKWLKENGGAIMRRAGF